MMKILAITGLEEVSRTREFVLVALDFVSKSKFDISVF